MKPRRLKALLGIELYKGRICIVELRRGGAGAPEVRHSMQAALSLDPFSAAPELAGKEIRNILDEAGIRTAHCIVCLPLSQPLIYQTALPEIPEADVAGFLQIEAERAFPFAPEDLIVAQTRYKVPGGERHAILLAMLAAQLAALEKTLRAAGLKPVSITLGAAALADPLATEPQAVISAAGPGVELLIAGDGGLIALRTLGEFEDAVDPGRAVDTVSMSREARVTLGRMPAALRDRIKLIRLYGSPAKCAALKDALAEELAAFGMTLQEGNPAGPAQLASGQAGALPPCATAAAARFLEGARSQAEFLVQRPHPLQLAAARFMARGMLWRLGAAAGVAVLITTLAFGWQHWRLDSLQNHWDAIEPQVSQLDGIQKKIHTFRPWFDDGIPSLEIARQLTSAFPESGSVWTRDLAVKDMSEVSCRGLAQTPDDVLRVQKNLASDPGVSDLNVTQLGQAGARGSGRTVEFRVTYQWTQEHGHGE